MSQLARESTIGVNAVSGRSYGAKTDVRSGGMADGEVIMSVSVACNVFW